MAFALSSPESICRDGGAQRLSLAAVNGSVTDHEAARAMLSKVDEQKELSTEDEDAEDSDEATQKRPSTRTKLRSLRKKTKARTKKIFTLSAGNATDDKNDAIDTTEALKNIENDPAFNPTKLSKQTTNPSLSSGRSPLDKSAGALKFIAKSVIHPKDAIKHKATTTTAAKLSAVQKPHVSQKADLEFLEAHDSLSRAQSSQASRQASRRMTSDEEEEDEETTRCRNKVEMLEAHRESIRVAWTTGHIDRVRVVPKRHFEFPKREAFVERDEKGEVVRYRWEKWLGHVLVYYTQDFSAQYIDDFDDLPFDLVTFRRHVERTVMASTPWQSWAMNVRAVYRWENPAFTMKWLALYVVLWYTEHIVGFLWAYIVYLVIKNRYFPTNVKSLRASVKRTVDQQGAAFQIGELIDKHGRENWLEPLIDEVGPYAQLQIGDIANMLEVFSNFYAWKAPSKTAGSLFFFASCFLVSVLTDTAYCMKIVWFIVGGFFFLSWPISSHHPKYRYLASPFKWVLWDIPTHAEWSFRYLRRQAQLSREKMIGQKVEKNYAAKVAASPPLDPSSAAGVPQFKLEDTNASTMSSDTDEDWHSVQSISSILSEKDIKAFRAQWQGVRGRLIIYSSGVRFVRGLVKKEMWDVPFIEMAEMRKLRGPRAPSVKIAKLLTANQLELKAMDGKVFFLESLRDRDEAFNCIIGFSNLQWQSLQGEPGQEIEKGHSTKSV